VSTANHVTKRTLRFGSLTIDSMWTLRGTLVRVHLAEQPPATLNPHDLLDATNFLSTPDHLPSIEPGTRGKVLRRIQQIPWGQTFTYGAIALDCATSPRAVGAICASNPHLIAIPCHRVIAATNQGGFAAGKIWKTLLLSTEKILLGSALTLPAPDFNTP